MKQVRSEMTKVVAFALETDDLQMVYSTMEALGVRHVPVVRGSKLIGIVSHRDVLLHAHADAHNKPQVPKRLVGEVMSRNVVACREADSIGSCVDRMLEKKISCLPVLDREDRLVGILTTTDLLRLLRDGGTSPSDVLPFQWKSVPVHTQWGDWRPSNS